MADGMRHNQLIHEKSPYLLQHAENPVDWVPWGEDAFLQAKRENKPIFLSIGYSTCHWCHVMAQESFEDAEVARLLNDGFVCIKVDREERPDIDHVYMTVCQVMTGGGGWPLTILMTPEKKPFMAMTYVPRESQFGRTGLLTLIPDVVDAWRTKPKDLMKTANDVSRDLQNAFERKSGGTLDASLLKLAFDQIEPTYDETNGGFGQAPKFPTPHKLLCMLRYYKRTGNKRALGIVEHTLEAMRRGGIYDQVGFGFHRYSTDPQWRVPHFEKMLYDQALMAMAYLEVYQETKKDLYASTVREIFGYVSRQMCTPTGAFGSAEGADSEGEEGKFYLWTQAEFDKALGKKESDFVGTVFGLDKAGNYVDPLLGEKNGKNILFLNRPLNEVAHVLGTSKVRIQERLEIARKRLFAVREKRFHPNMDDKILTDWNGLMIAVLAKGARVLLEPKYAVVARDAVSFILRHLRTDDGRLFHRFRSGEAAIPACLDDYAFLVWGLLELYETTFDSEYLRVALELNRIQIKHFWDTENGGFFMTADDVGDLIVRPKDIYDGAIPSGNSVAMMNLLRLAKISANSDFFKKAQQLGRCFSEQVSLNPSMYCQLMLALDFMVGPTFEVVIVGSSNGPDTINMIDALRRLYVPNKVVLFKPTDQTAPEIVRIANYTGDYGSKDGKATAYVCRNYTCSQPTTDVNQMVRLLKTTSG